MTPNGRTQTQRNPELHTWSPSHSEKNPAPNITLLQVKQQILILKAPTKERLFQILIFPRSLNRRQKAIQVPTTQAAKKISYITCALTNPARLTPPATATGVLGSTSTDLIPILVQGPCM